MSVRPFHYAFVVRDLARTRHFYGELLECREGRSSDTWVDFDFFGNQISAHLGEPADGGAAGLVDGISVPIPHFGAVLAWQHFHRLAERLRDAKIEFVIEPRLRYEGRAGEQATMFLTDPSGNPLEFKAFRDESELFESSHADDGHT